MPKDRLRDTLDYLTARAGAGRLPSVGVRDVADFEKKVRDVDRTNGGNALSLGWSRLDRNRPDENTRHAIRAYLLASIYNNDVTATGAHAEAVRVKTFGTDWLHRKIAKRIRQYLCLDDPINTQAILYRLHKKGSGAERATGVCERLDLRVEDELARRVKQEDDVGVVLIDMQSGGDVGQNRQYGGKTILEHQQAVLAIVKECNVVIYDIVIDAKGADEFGKAYELKDLGRREKAEILKRQRRLSYGDEAAVQTIAVLRDYFKAGTRVRHIPKPSHPTFTGTLFAEHLETDGIKAVVVMGYDANQCIKATVFGVPSETREEAQREPSAKEVERVMQFHPQLTVQEAQKQATPMKKVTIPYVPGLLDRNITVITSRAVMASSYRALEPEWGIIASLS
jgi:nicotinamidase-related amidase